MNVTASKVFVTGLCSAFVMNFWAVPSIQGAAVPVALQGNLNSDKARYNPGAPVRLQATMTNSSAQTVTGNVYLWITHLNQSVGSLPVGHVSIAPHTSKTMSVTWNPPKNDYQGYLIEGVFQSDMGKVMASFHTAVDVSSDWTRFPRYGFVSQYPLMSTSAMKNELSLLNEYHIDGLQFYDWQWMHHVPVAGSVSHPAASWRDIAGRMTYRQTVLGLINAGHQLGMKAMNYNLLYGAWDGYQSNGSGVKPAWGLYSDSGAQTQVHFPMPSGWSTTGIDVFNPANPAWQKYILGQESRVFTAYPFDGWQVDQLGDQGTVYDAQGQYVGLESTFASFLNNASKTLHKQIIFNDVGEYGLLDVASKSDESLAYVECWPNSGQVSYDDLRGVINTVNTFSKGKKSTVLAAYMDSDYANSFSAQSPGYFNPAGVLLTDATIFASGGDHIELGDNLQMLNAPYFPNHNLVLSQSLKNQLLSYYNFMVAYENLLRGGLTTTHNPVLLQGLNTSSDGMPRTVWTFTKRGSGYNVIHLINLYGQRYTAWDDSDAIQTVPTTLHNVKVKYYMSGDTIRSIDLASPDMNQGNSTPLSFAKGHDSKGYYVSFTIPSLSYWDMVYMRTQ